MSNSFHLQDLLMFFICLAAGALFAWVLYWKTKYVDQRIRILLAVSRAISVALILWLLFSPLVKRVSYMLEKPLVVIAQDNSLSVGHIEPEGFDPEKYQADFKKVADQLSEKYEVKIYHFSDSVKPGFDFSNQGKVTNASALMSKLSDELTNRNVGAVILATDGIFNKGGNPLNELQKLKAPVYTVALGDTVPRKDVLIANVNYNNLVYLDNEFTIDVQVQAFESANEETVLSVFEQSKKVHEEKITITNRVFVKNLFIKLKAAQLGSKQFTVKLSPLKKEVSDRNNSQVFVVDVIDDRQKVLIAAAGPHPDLAALKQAIETNKHYEVKTILSKDLDAVDPQIYSLAILYQLPGQLYNARPLISKLQQAKIPVWYVLGVQTDIAAFNQVQNQVALGGTNGTIQEVSPLVNPSFTGFEFNDAYQKIISTYDPLQVPYGQLSVNGSYTAILNQKTNKTGALYPELFFMSYNGLKTGYLVGEGIWRWKLSEAKDQAPEVLGHLISQSVQYLTVKDDKRKFKVYAAKTSFDETEHVVINASLYNDNYQPVNTPDVFLKLKNEQGKVYNFTFSKLEKAYQLDAGLLSAGSYTYTAETVLGGKKYTSAGAFFVNALFAEYQQTTANHQLLYTMSAQTNGKMYGPQQLKELVNDLEHNEAVKTLSYEDRKYEELINFKWLFVVIFALLSLEWFVRKRNGLQ